MLNYRLVTVTILLSGIIFPIAFHWALTPHGGWFRPYVVWGLIIYASYLVQRHRNFDES